MVYGLMRVDALARAGIFRRVLRPDRLLMAELTLQRTASARYPKCSGSAASRPARASTGSAIRWCSPVTSRAGSAAPPWFQHSLVLWREYARAGAAAAADFPRAAWAGMLVRYQVTYGWRHFRKTGASHAIGPRHRQRRLDEEADQALHTARHLPHARRDAPGMGAHAARCQIAIYETLVAIHRGLT